MKTAVVALAICLLAVGIAAPVAQAEPDHVPVCHLEFEERTVHAGPVGVIHPAPYVDCDP